MDFARSFPCQVWSKPRASPLANVEKAACSEPEHVLMLCTAETSPLYQTMYLYKKFEYKITKLSHLQDMEHHLPKKYFDYAVKI